MASPASRSALPGTVSSNSSVLPQREGSSVFFSVSDPHKFFHADPGSLKCPYGSGFGSRPLILYPDPDPKGVKMKEENLYKQIFN